MMVGSQDAAGGAHVDATSQQPAGQLLAIAEPI